MMELKNKKMILKKMRPKMEKTQTANLKKSSKIKITMLKLIFKIKLM